MFRLASFIIGYLFGNILTAYFVARACAGKSPFEIGSGNPGMANVMSECGFKAGIIVLAGDLLKTFVACLLCRFVIFAGDGGILGCLYAGLGAVCGHNFPFWHKFKGGKGVSATCAAMFCIHPLWGIGVMLAGAAITFITKYLSVGALCIPVVFIAPAYVLCGFDGIIVYVLMAIIMIYCHRMDFVRISQGTEKKVDVLLLIKKKLTK